MANLTPGHPKAQGPDPQSLDAMKTAAALWILDLGVSATEARQWATAVTSGGVVCEESAA